MSSTLPRPATTHGIVLVRLFGEAFLTQDTRNMTSPIAYCNGQFLPVNEISISPFDRGFLVGDGVYEVIPVYAGVPLRAREHFDRLQRSMDEIQLCNPHSVDEWMGIVAKL